MRLSRLIDLPGATPLGRAAFVWLALAATGLVCSGLAAQGVGRVEGRVLAAQGKGVEGVVVQIDKTGSSAVVTDRRGAFALEAVPEGAQTVVLSLGEDSLAVPIEVTAGGTVEVEQTVDWSLSVADTLTVYAASRRREKIVDAPAAISTLTEREISREAPTGQIPALFGSLPGAELSQSGLYDYKFNARGANISVNRRVAVLIDGRDPSFPLLGSQEWASNSFPMDDLEGAELVRGPSSALYGANAFNGIVNLTTKAPRNSQGGLFRLTGGELSTVRADFRLAGGISERTFYKVLGSVVESDDFYRSRNTSVEYSTPCLPQVRDCLFLEAVPLPQDGDKIVYAGGRIDHHLSDGQIVTAEVGTAEVEGYVLSAPGSRFQITDLSRPWGRLNYNSPRWNALLSYTGREAEATTLSAGTLAFTDSFRASFEVQGNWNVGQGRGRVVAGLWVAREDIDSADPNGVQTLLPEPKTDDLRAVFGQFDWDLSPELKLVVAARVDDSQFYDPEISPKVALVWEVKPGQNLRFGYNSGFLRPNYPEYFVRVPVAPPLDLSLFEELLCTPVGVNCGFDRPVPLLAVGNKDLTVESIQSVEVGYKAILNGRGFLTIDGYWTKIEDFVQQFIPQLGTRLGRTNPNFGPYAPPADLPEPFASLLVASLDSALTPFGLFPFLSTDRGRPVFALNTAINFGEVETQGAEIAIDYPLADGWSLSANYSWLSFDVKDELPEAPLEANGPENKVNMTFSYAGDRLGGAVSARWFDGFPWAEGFLIGDVPSYTVVNLSAGFDLTESWTVGLNVNNVLNERHFEIFGGDILERRALGYVSHTW